MEADEQSRRGHLPDNRPAPRPSSGRLRLAAPALDRLPDRAVLDLWQAVGGTSQPMYLADAGGNLIYSNPAYDRIAAAMRHQDSVGVSDIAAAVDALGRPLRQEVAVDIGGQREDYIAERTVVRNRAGEPFAVVARYLPAGELQRLETALKLAEARLADVARLSSDWIWETDRELTITFVSGRGCERLGFAARELVGRSLRDLAAPAPLLDALFPEHSPRPFHDASIEMRHKESGWRRFLLSAVAVFDDAGAFRGYRGTAQDVSERDAQYAAMVAAVEHAQSASRAKTEFLANMSHELRTPLNAIMGFSEAMKIELIGPLGNARYREYAEDIHASSGHLLRLINDVLDVGKIEAGRMELDEDEIAAADLLQVVHRVVAENASRAKLELELRCPSDLPRLRADERRLKQVLLNLLSNAIKFTPAGGRVTLSAERSASGGIDFVVADTGVGIAPDQIATAMSPFRQLDSGLARKFEGTGLGLPLSKALTELHGGTLELESRVSEGTTARVRLPATRVLPG